jgi:serine/alanine adding enzyme
MRSLVRSDDSIVVEQAGDAAAAEWDRFVASSPAATTYHRYGWRGLAARVFGKETHYLLARQQGAVAGILPLVRLKSRLFGDFLVSLPYLSYGGVVACSGVVRERLLSEAIALATRLGVSHIEFRHRASDTDLPARKDKVTMLLDLPDTAELLWKQCGAKLRSQVKRPQKEGAECVSGGMELLPDFYAVFAENMRDLGTPVYPQRFFAEILQLLDQQARVFVVRWRGVPVAAGFVIGHGATLEIPWASSLRKANAIGVNMLLYWSILEYACQAGYRVFDFGRCTVDSGPHKFKKQWGARPQQLYWHYWLRGGGELPRLNHSNPKFGAAIAVWRRLPLAVTNRLGPILIGNLP